MDPIGLGIILATSGLLLFLITRLVIRKPGQKTETSVEVTPKYSPLEENSESLRSAVLVVQAGGKLVYANPQARQMFKASPDEALTLERISRRVRPAELFLELCTHEGQNRFVLDGRLVEGASYFLATKPQPLISLMFYYPEAISKPATTDLTSQSLKLFMDFTQALSEQEDLESLIKAILENVERLFPTDRIEVTLWNEELSCLVPYHLVDSPIEGRKIEMSSEYCVVGEGYSGHIALERKPLLVSDVELSSPVALSIDRKVFPLHSYLGVPMTLGDTLIGTIELSSFKKETYQSDDIGVLGLFAEQSAIAIQKSQLQIIEQRLAGELRELEQLGQAFSAWNEPKNMFPRLVQSIKPFIPVEVLGFLTYNENNRILEGRNPFIGIPPQFVELFRSNIPPGSDAEQLLLQQTPIISNNAAESAQWASLGFIFLSQAANLRETVLMPLISGGRMLGFLLAGNHSNGRTIFAPEEIQMLNRVGNLVAPVIENAILWSQNSQKTLKSEALRRIAMLSSSSSRVDDILKLSIKELAFLFQAKMALLLLVDRNRRVLQVHRLSAYCEITIPQDAFPALPLDDVQFPFTVCGAQHSILSNNVPEEQMLIPFYQQHLLRFNAQSVLIAPLVARDNGIGELWLVGPQLDYFELSDVQYVTVAVTQLASILEQQHLVSQTDENLRRQVEQLNSLKRISLELNTSSNIDFLLQMFFDETLKSTKADSGTMLIFDHHQKENEIPKIVSRFGDPRNEELLPLELEILNSNEPVLYKEVLDDTIWVPHDTIQSVLIVPVRFKIRKVGLIFLYSQESERFDDISIEMAESLASQIAVSLGSIVQYEDETHQTAILKQQLTTLEKLFDVSQKLRPNFPLTENLQLIAQGILATTKFQSVVISIYDPVTRFIRRICEAGLPVDAWDINNDLKTWSDLQDVLKQDFRISTVYFIPSNKPYVPAKQSRISVSVNAWQEGDLLLAPLYNANGAPLGVIRVGIPLDGLRPDKFSIEPLELFSTQAALMIESFRYINALVTNLSELEAGHGRIQQSVGNVRRQIPQLLKRDFEQTIELQSMRRQMEWAQAVPDIVQEINRQQDIQSLLQSLAEEMLSRFGLHIALIAEKTSAAPRLLSAVGLVIQDNRIEAHLGQRNPLRQVIQDKKVIRSEWLEQDPTWRNTALLNAMDAKSFIALPLEIGRERTVGILLVGRYPLPFLSVEDQKMLEQLVGQVNISIRNLDLLNETRIHLREVNLLLDFSRKLSGLSPSSIMRSLVESILLVIPAADVGWVGIWDEKNNALLITAAQGYLENEEMLGLELRLDGDLYSVAYDQLPLPLRVLRSMKPWLIEEVHFVRDYNFSSDHLMHYRQAIGGKLPLSSLLVPLQRGNKPMGVLVLDSIDTVAAFTKQDEALALSLSQQTALVLENADLYVNAERRAVQLQTMNQFAKLMTSSLNRDDLVGMLLDQFKAIVPYDTATIWLREADRLIITETAGFTDAESRRGVSVSLEDSKLFQGMAKNRAALLVPDVRLDERFTTLVEAEYFSWLGIPLLSKAELFGVIALEKREADFYTPEHVQTAVTFAGQAAISLENARFFEESMLKADEIQQRSQRLALLNQLSAELISTLEYDAIIRLTSQQLVQALNIDRVAIVMADGEAHYHLEYETPAFETPSLRFKDFSASPLLDRLEQSMGVFSAVDISTESEISEPLKTYFQQRNIRSILVIPLETAGKLHGWFWLQTEEERHFEPVEIELARTIGNQSAIAIQNARLFDETNRLTNDLERRVEERTAELKKAHHNTQTLLRVIQELTASLNLEDVIYRTLNVLNESLGAEQSLVVMANGMATIYQAGLPLIDTSYEHSFFVVRPEQEIAQWVIEHRVSLLVEDIKHDASWRLAENNGRTHIPPEFSSVVSVPLALGEQVMGVLILVHREVNFFKQEDNDLLEAAARQISVTLNNAQLYELSRDQADRLVDMLGEQQVDSSRSRAILESIADGVLVTDSTNIITLFNPAAERILNLQAFTVLGQVLDKFSGVFGKVGQPWMKTIHEWFENPEAFQSGDTYAEKIDLDDGRVVLIQLAPVKLGDKLLGTVTIFRDITQEVRVDRLKSDFVANVSHELRTPITSIKGYTDLLLMGAGGEMNEQQRRFMQIVRDNTQRLNVLVNDLLDISQLEAGKLVLSIQPLEIAQLAEEVLAILRKRSEEQNKPMAYEMQVSEDLGLVRGDTEHVRQILMNLIGNAYNYTPLNGKIKVVIHQEGQEIQVDVIDNGIGITLEDHERIFERFYRGEDPLVLATAGTGLGLAISKSLIEMQGGRIWFESTGTRNGGTTFSFVLPVYQAEE